MSTDTWRMYAFPFFEHLQPSEPMLHFSPSYRKTKHTFHVTLVLEMQAIQALISLGAWEAVGSDGNSCKLPKSSLRGWLRLCSSRLLAHSLDLLLFKRRQKARSSQDLLTGNCQIVQSKPKSNANQHNTMQPRPLCGLDSVGCG